MTIFPISILGYLIYCFNKYQNENLIWPIILLGSITLLCIAGDIIEFIQWKMRTKDDQK